MKRRQPRIEQNVPDDATFASTTLGEIEVKVAELDKYVSTTHVDSNVGGHAWSFGGAVVCADHWGGPITIQSYNVFVWQYSPQFSELIAKAVVRTEDEGRILLAHKCVCCGATFIWLQTIPSKLPATQHLICFA